jgi:hypothetical protein
MSNQISIAPVKWAMGIVNAAGKPGMAGTSGDASSTLGGINDNQFPICDVLHKHPKCDDDILGKLMYLVGLIVRQSKDDVDAHYVYDIFQRYKKKGSIRQTEMTGCNNLHKKWRPPLTDE